MGYSTAEALALDPHMTLEQGVSIHFQSNCYPPIPQFMVPIACEAIVAASAGDWGMLLDLPEGVAHRQGRTQVTAEEVIENCRLDAFVMYDVEGDC